MIITDLTYQEIAADANELEGGIDLSVNFTNFNKSLTQLESASQSTEAGSVSKAAGASLNVSTFGVGGVGLGLTELPDLGGLTA